tara:strand:- start:4310 stop:4624 length:315 start_codon:yes stop_codon:yes gene_type:complete
LKKNEKQKIIDRAKKEVYKEISVLLNSQAAALNQYQFKISAALQVANDFAEKNGNGEAEQLLYKLSEILLVKTIDPMSLDIEKLRDLKNKFEQNYISKNYSSQE